MPDPSEQLEEIEEIDVTKLLERLDALEKENIENKARLAVCEESLDTLANHLKGRR